MTIARTTLVLLAGAALLAACNKAGPGNAAAGSSGAAQQTAASSGPDIAITADQLPTPKAGEWQVSMTNNAAGIPHAVTDKSCYSGKPMNPKQMAKDCQTFTLKKTFLGEYVIDAKCSPGEGVQMTMHVTMHGDFLGGSYTSDSTASMIAPNRPPMTFTTHTEAHYLGPCAPGETPADQADSSAN